MANKKMTKKEMFTQLLNNYELTDAEITFINREIELLDKKNGAIKKPTKQQEANAEIRGVIAEFMADGEWYTITDLMKNIPELAELSNQRVSAIVRGMKESGVVERKEEKRKAYFRLAQWENLGAIAPLFFLDCPRTCAPGQFFCQFAFYTILKAIFCII